MPASQPNLLFLLNDHQVHYRHGWDGGPVVRRPHFDRLARGGVDFSRAYSACPLCGPARRSMLTGRYPHNHGEVKNDINEPFDRDTCLELLARAGYRNYYYGKWHAGPGTAFDHACEGFSYPSYGNPYTKPEYRDYLQRKGLPEPEILIERTFSKTSGPDGAPLPDRMRAGQPYRQNKPWCNEHGCGILTTPKETHEAFFLASLACDRLRELAREGAGRPFHLRVDFWGPHQPYFVTREFADLYDPAAIPEYPSFRDDLSGKPEIYRSESNEPLNRNGKIIVPNPLPWSDWQLTLARAYAQVTLVDAAAGMILDTLEELGLAGDTMVLYTTDHGDALASHGGHFDKRSYLPEEMIRIPMALRWPGRVAPGQQCDRLVSNLDVAPTLLDAAGLRFDRPVDGASVLPLATGGAAGWRDDFMVETHGHGEDHLGRALLTDRFKYVWNDGQMDELYDLWLDPYEMRNLIDDPAHAATLADLRARLAACRERSNDHPEAPDSAYQRAVRIIAERKAAARR